MLDGGAVPVVLLDVRGTKVEEFTFGCCGAVIFPDGATGVTADDVPGYFGKGIINY